MSQYDVKVYIPKDLYKKLHYIASSGGISVPALLGRIIKDDSVIQTIDSAYRLLKQVKEGGMNERETTTSQEKMGADSV